MVVVCRATACNECHFANISLLFPSYSREIPMLEVNVSGPLPPITLVGRLLVFWFLSLSISLLLPFFSLSFFLLFFFFVLLGCIRFTVFFFYFFFGVCVSKMEGNNSIMENIYMRYSQNSGIKVQGDNNGMHVAFSKVSILFFFFLFFFFLCVSVCVCVCVCCLCNRYGEYDMPGSGVFRWDDIAARTTDKVLASLEIFKKHVLTLVCPYGQLDPRGRFPKGLSWLNQQLGGGPRFVQHMGKVFLL